MTLRARKSSRALGVVALLAMSHAHASAQVLISQEEAALPDVPLSEPRALLPGPIATALSPKDGSTVTSPFTFEIDFKTFGGARMGSIEIWYVKNPAVPLTQKLSKYFSPNESNPRKLLFAGAEAPTGHHVIRIEMTD